MLSTIYEKKSCLHIALGRRVGSFGRYELQPRTPLIKGHTGYHIYRRMRSSSERNGGLGPSCGAYFSVSRSGCLPFKQEATAEYLSVQLLDPKMYKLKSSQILNTGINHEHHPGSKCHVRWGTGHDTRICRRQAVADMLVECVTRTNGVYHWNNLDRAGECTKKTDLLGVTWAVEGVVNR